MTIKNLLDIFDRPTAENIVATTEEANIYQLSEEDNEVITEEDNTN